MHQSRCLVAVEVLFCGQCFRIACDLRPRPLAPEIGKRVGVYRLYARRTSPGDTGRAVFDGSRKVGTGRLRRQHIWREYSTLKIRAAVPRAARGTRDGVLSGCKRAVSSRRCRRWIEGHEMGWSTVDGREMGWYARPLQAVGRKKLAYTRGTRAGVVYAIPKHQNGDLAQRDGHEMGVVPFVLPSCTAVLGRARARDMRWGGCAHYSVRAVPPGKLTAVPRRT